MVIQISPCVRGASWPYPMQSMCDSDLKSAKRYCVVGLASIRHVLYGESSAQERYTHPFSGKPSSSVM